MIEIVVYAIIGINLAICLRILASQYRQRKLRKEFEHNINYVQELMKDMFILRAEQVGDGFYIYNQVTNEFICQGKTIDEIILAFSKRFPGRKALIDQGHELIFKEKSYE